VRFVNRSWTPDRYFSLRGENVQRECSGTATRERRFPILSPGAEYPSYATETRACFKVQQWRIQEFPPWGAYPAFHGLVPIEFIGGTAQPVIAFV